MKTLICVTICLFSLCQGFPAGEVSTQDQARSSKVLVPVSTVNVHSMPAVPAQKVAQSSSLQSYLQANHDQIKQLVVHFIKAYFPKQHVERWYNLSSSDRECISNVSRSLGQLWIGGNDLFINSQDNWATHLKLACPNASAEINDWHEECLAHRTNASANWTTNYKKLPQTVQTFLTNLNETFDSLRRTGVLVRLSANITVNDTTLIKDALLPVVQEFLAIPQSDWDQVAVVFPRTEKFFGSNGTLHTHIFVLARALDDYLTNGTVPLTNLGAIIQAQDACKKYSEETLMQYAPALKKQIDSAPEQEFSSHAQSELENSVHTSLNAVAENAPSS